MNHQQPQTQETSQSLRLDAARKGPLKKPLRRFKRSSNLVSRRRGKVGAPPRQPTREIARLERELLAIAGSHNVALLQAIRPLFDAEGTITPGLLAELRRRVRASISFDRSGAAKVAVQTIDRLDRFNRADVRRSIGVDVPEFSAELGQKWRSEQVSLIKSMGEKPKARFLKLFEESSKKQTRVETLKKQLEEEFGVSARRARLIARDQVLTLNAKLNEDRQKKAGITEYVWRTVGDGSVRSNHSHLNGKRFKYANPPMGGGTSESERGNPGDGIGCRCQAIPVVPEFDS